MNIKTFFLVSSFLVVIALNFSYAIDEDAIKNSDEDRHENRPRVFGGIFSRPKPQAEKMQGIGLRDHLGNVLRGGSIGFQAEFRPLAPVHGLIDHAKKVIPIPGINKPHLPFIPMHGKEPKEPGSWWMKEEKDKPLPIPDYEWKNSKDDSKSEDYPKDYPKSEDYPKDNPKSEDYPKDYPKSEDYPKDFPKSEDHSKDHPKTEDLENEEGPYGWEHQNPKKVKTNGPRWEDIGEDVSEYYNDHTTVPIEEIIQPRIRSGQRPRISQPRIRSKRRAESKVYYLPLDFLTNGRPYKVRIGANDSV